MEALVDVRMEKGLINLIGKIPEDKQREIAAGVCADYSTDVQSRAEWEDNRERWYKLWACKRDVKSNPWENASNVCVPMLATACNQFHARAYQSIFAPPGMVKVIPVGEADYRRAQNVEKFMNWQVMYEMEEYEEVMDKLLQLLPINGVAFKKLYYSPELDRPVTEYISPLDLILPYRTKDVETARRLVHRIWLHYDELLDRNEMGLYENFDMVGKAPTAGVEGRNPSEIDVGGEQAASPGESPHLILECHKKHDLGDGVRKPYVFTVDHSSRALLRVASREFKRGAEVKVINNFTDYHFIPNPEGFYSFGFGHFLEPLNEMANTVFNQIFDSGTLSNLPFFFYGRRSGLKRSKVKLHPGAGNEVDDASQILFPTMQRVDNTLFMLLGLIQQYTEQFTSTSDYLTGREAKGTKTPTAHGTLAIIEQGLVTFAVMTKRIFRSLRKELRLHMLFNQMFLPDEKQYRVMESEKKIAFPKLKRDDFGGVKDVIPVGDPSYASKLTRRQDAVERYQLLMTNPLIAGVPPSPAGEGGSPPNVRAIYELTSDVLDSYDCKNKSKILPEPPEEPLTPEMENAMFMQGDYKSPLSGENHDVHMQVHVAFTRTDFYEFMDGEYKPLLMRHLAETRRVAYLDSVQARQLGGSPLGEVWTPAGGENV